MGDGERGGNAGGGRADDLARQARDHPVLEYVARFGMAAYGVVYLLVAWLAAQLSLGDPSGSASGEGALQELASQPAGGIVLWAVAAGLAGLAVRQGFEAVGGHRDEEGPRRWGLGAASAVRGCVFAVLAFLAVRTAVGSGGSGGSGGTGGLTADLLRLPLGPAIVVAVGLVVIGVGGASAWRGLGDRWRRDLEVDGQTGQVGRAVTVLARTGYVARGAAFGLIGALFVRAGLTHDPDESGGLDRAIVELRDEPFGPWLLVGIAAGLGCYGVYHVARGWWMRND
ncbi:DUF1206 domain-containing protein [Nocardioides caeni]